MNMTSIFFIFLIILAVPVITFVLKLSKLEPSPDKPKAFQKLLYRQRSFLTKSELAYFRELEETYSSSYYIIPQVLLSSIVDVDMPPKFYAYKGYRSKIDKKTLDFVLFDKVSFAPVVAIELDDYTHDFPERKERDIFVNNVLEKVGVKIERKKFKRVYNQDMSK